MFAFFRQLEEGHVQVQRALETNDINSSGYISRSDLKDVLQILGIHIKATNLEHFLARCKSKTSCTGFYNSSCKHEDHTQRV